MSKEDQYDIDDIESFIKGLKDTFDSLDELNPNTFQGLQLQLARAISLLRHKKIAKIEQIPKVNFETPASKEVLKNFLLNKLEFLIVMQITKMRERLNQL